MLYKNIEKKYLEAFWREGEVKLGSLRYFRKIEDPKRRDELEGLRGLRIRPQEIIRTDTGDFWTPHNVKIGTTGKSAYIQLDPGSHVDIHEHLPDAYILSVSEVRLPGLADSAYRISNPNEFGRALAKALKIHGAPVIGGAVASVRYGGHKDDLTDKTEVQKAVTQLACEWGLGDYFLKPTSFETEKEWRYIFILAPDARADDEKKVHDMELSKFCERLS